jgi:plastocyanin
MSKKYLWVAMVVLVASLALTACGGSGSAGSTSITTTMTDFHFEPTTWTVPAGKEITLKLVNNGSVEHDWVLLQKPVTPPAEQNSSNELFSAQANAGETKTVTFTAPSAPGEYKVICTIPGHLEAGMSGKLVVVQP